MIIPIIQYMRPDGKKIIIDAEMDNPDVYEKAKKILDAGLKFETEILMNGLISTTISNDKEDLDIRITENNEEVKKVFEEMVLNFKIDGGNTH
jgi:hypothetical protein